MFFGRLYKHQVFFSGPYLVYFFNTTLPCLGVFGSDVSPCVHRINGRIEKGEECQTYASKTLKAIIFAAMLLRSRKLGVDRFPFLSTNFLQPLFDLLEIK